MHVRISPSGFLFNASEAWSEQLAPLTDLRHGVDLRTGALTTRERLIGRLGLGALLDQTPAGFDADSNVIFVNARWLGVGDPTGHAFQDVGPSAPSAGEAWLAGDGPLEGQVLAVGLRLDDSATQAWLNQGCQGVPAVSASKVLHQVHGLERPWDVLDALPETLKFDAVLLAGHRWSEHPFAGVQHLHRTEDLESAGFAAVHVLGAGGVLLGTGVELAPTVVLDARRGPVILGDGVQIHPHAVLQGPCAVMNQSVIHPQTSLRAGTVIGPVCKVGGEVSCSVLQGYSNKGHDGFLGHGLVGAWCNLGAGTTASNLKNTYGSVRVRQSASAEAMDTGRTFMGPILGDYVRTAIGTRLMTGSVIGSGTMIATSAHAPVTTGRCRFITDRGDQPHDLDALRTVMTRMMARRDLTLDPEMFTRLCTLSQREQTDAKMRLG